MSQRGSPFPWFSEEQPDRRGGGDRHYYFNQMQDSPLLLADFGTQRFADIVMRNTGLDHMHHSAFRVSERMVLGPREADRDFSALPASAEKAYVFVANALDNAITGTDGDDALYGEAGDDTLDGGAGLDALHGCAGHDLIVAGAGSRGVFGYGGDGNDTLRGGSGD